MVHKNYEKWHEAYTNDKIVDLKSFFSEKQLEILAKLDIIIRDELYTYYELDMFERSLLDYYTTEMAGEDNEQWDFEKELPFEVNTEEFLELIKSWEEIHIEIHNQYNLPVMLI